MAGDCEVADELAIDVDCFKIRASGGGRASVVDAGFDFPDVGTAGRRPMVYTDLWNGCRPDATEWDVGADEYAASACGTEEPLDDGSSTKVGGGSFRGGRW